MAPEATPRSFDPGDPQWPPELAQLVRSGIAVDAAEGFVEVGGQWVGGSDGVGAGMDLDDGFLGLPEQDGEDRLTFI